MKTDKQTTINALLKERQGYAQRNLRDRVAAVDKSLEELGFLFDGSFVGGLETATIAPTSERAVLRKPAKKRT